MRLLRVVISFVTLLMSGRSLPADGIPTAETFFHQQIEPILVGHCLECHGGAGKGELDLRTRAAALAGGESGTVIEPGNPDDSLLYEYVSSHDMPPKKPLTAEQILAIKKWITDGVYFPQKPIDAFSITTNHRAGYDWWSLQPLKRSDVADTKDIPGAWNNNPIDRFVYTKLAKNGLQPSPPADSKTLIRRATYDLLGLPPTPEEVDAFLTACRQETGDANQVGEQTFERLIHELLRSKHYGEHWGCHWLDVIRFGESNGFERNVIHNNVWPFRDYVIRSLNNDKPFDRIVLEHLAGDVLGPDDPEVAVGTTFLVCGPYDNVVNKDLAAAAQIRANTIDEIIRTTSEAFLGLTVGCSRCHDHKFDPISQQDYYAMYATFAGVQHGERAIRTKQNKRQLRELEAVKKRIEAVEEKLLELQPNAFVGRTIVLDDEMPQSDAATLPGVQRLQPHRGHGTNPPGTERGYRDDPGDFDRTANVSGQRYQWWDNRPGVDLFSWNPAADGRFRVWLSWGCGWPSHTSDAQYLLDFDGDLETKSDQKLIATVDQQHFAHGGPEPLPKQALWSGFVNAGVHEFTPASRIVLRGGRSGQAATADVVVLQEEVNGLASAVNLRQPRFRRAVHPKVNSERIGPVEARYVRFTISATNSLEPCIDEIEVYTVRTDKLPSKNVAVATAGGKATSSGNYEGNPTHQLNHVNDGEYGNSRSWISNKKGAGWVQIEFAEQQWIDHIVWGRDREEEYSDRLATSYKIEVATEPGKWRRVASSTDRLPLTNQQRKSGIRPLFVLPSDQIKQARSHLEKLKSLRSKVDRLIGTVNSPKWRVGNFQQVNGPFRVFIGGSPQRHGVEVKPASMKALARSTHGYELESSSPENERRMALAKWIVAADNPLSPRVLANRLWHYHFGAGIVSTPSDFGYLGGRPSHPELLDWLAIKLKDDSWRLKPMHKRIMLSQTYRQASDFRVEAAKLDNDSRLLWRYPPRRLSGEEIRDSALAIAGKLDTRMGGPGFRLFRYVQDNVATYYPLDKHGPETYRRAVYHHNARAMQIDLMTEFDTPDCAFSTPRRSSTTTPLQALTLMNHSFTTDMADAFAERIERDVDTDDLKRRVTRAFLLAFSRPPDVEETRAAERLIETYGSRAFCRALLNANEFIYLD